MTGSTETMRSTPRCSLPERPSAPPTSSSAPRIVGLALATGYIHSTLGGLLFTLNAVGYAVAALAMIIPLALAVRFRWVVRLGLIGYALTTILGWAIQGPYYQTAYIAKAIEVALIVLVAVDFARMDGNPITVVKRELASFAVARRQPQRRGRRRRLTNAAAGSPPGRDDHRQGVRSDEAPRPGPGPRGPRRHRRRLFRRIRCDRQPRRVRRAGSLRGGGRWDRHRGQGPRVLADAITAPADEAFQILLDNQESAPAQHRHQGRVRAPCVFKGEIVTSAPRSRTTSRPSPPAPTSSSAKSTRT